MKANSWTILQQKITCIKVKNNSVKVTTNLLKVLDIEHDQWTSLISISFPLNKPDIFSDTKQLYINSLSLFNVKEIQYFYW